MNTVKVENCKTLFIGRRGENEVTEVVFDFSEWQEQFGAGVIDLYVKRNLDIDAYPVVLSVDGTVATWLVTAADTDVVGNGKIEFVYTVNEKVAKSAVFPFFVGEDIGESSPEPPEHYQSWLEQLTELGAETQANAQAAAQSASEAAESAAQVAEDSNNAEAWAVGERNGEPVSEDDPTYNNNAKYWAENARANAPVQSVNGEDGDVVLTLDDIPNGETYVRATPEQLAQITTNAENIASVEAIASTALQPDDLTPYRTAAQQSSIDNDLNSKINRNTGSIADINARIPFSASASNKLVDKNSFDSKLSDYRTASQQNLIDNNKQTKITANGILKGNGFGGISAAVAGMDYLPTSALAAYRSANAQDAIDNAQNQNINKNTAAINTMQPAATAADIGKALIVKTVADGKPTSYEYGEAGGGGSALTAGDGINITDDVISNTQGIEYIVGTQAAATSKWTGVSTDETLKVGKIIAYYLPFAGTSTAATLALTMADGTTTREISLQLKPNATVTTQFPAGSIIILVYDGTYWRVNASYDTDTNTNPTGYCLTNGSVAAKAATCSFGYRGDANYFPCLFRFANTATDATLAITTYAPEAAPIYVNGARTSATNTFSAGVILFLYYNGAYYCYNDGRFPILVDGAVTSVQEYATGLLVNYRTAAAQDTIDSGKQAKITATGILKGVGAGGVSSATAGTDYATPQQVNEKYAKPSGGIPSTDMTAAVQASLSKADTALQAVPDTYRTAADQDLIDNGKQAKITASGILKGDGAGGVSAAVAGVDYLKSAPVTSVNGQTGDVTIQTATDAQVTTAVNTWLGENVAQETGYVLDASLTMSNAAPPASAVGELKSATIGGELNKTVVKNEYVNNAGVINAYNGWGRTDYILVAGWRKLKVTASSASNYNVFYDINKNFIYATATDRTINIVSGENEVLVPPNAYYAIFSGTAAYTEALKIEAIERYADYRDNKLLQYDRDLLNGKQVLVVDPNDLTIGYIIGNDGSVTADVRRAIFSEYYQILRPQNKYLITCPGFRVYICEYTAENGEYVFQKRSQLANGSVFWATTKTTHIRFALETVNSNSIGKIFVSAFCDVFSMRELNDINTYLRVCTFNQAQGYAKFAHANLADATKRKINFLNFIGEYNPDILCAQEALGDYFCPDEEKLPVNNVFNRKYIFHRQSGYQRRTWSKYNYKEPETITFTHQATGDSRFYGKETYLIEGKEIVVLNAHCAYQGDSDFDLARKGQFEELVAEMQQHTYCICCGDFNAWNADEFNVFTNAGLSCSNCGDYGEIDTWNVGTDYPDWPFKAVDNIITTPSIVIQNVVRGPYDFDYFSDHAPLIADLQIR